MWEQKAGVHMKDGVHIKELLEHEKIAVPVQKQNLQPFDLGSALDYVDRKTFVFAPYLPIFCLPQLMTIEERFGAYMGTPLEKPWVNTRFLPADHPFGKNKLYANVPGELEDNVKVCEQRMKWLVWKDASELELDREKPGCVLQYPVYKWKDDFSKGEKHDWLAVPGKYYHQARQYCVKQIENAAGEEAVAEAATS